MESTIDFFRFLAREDFIALSKGNSIADAIAARRECQSVSLGKWHGRPAGITRQMRVPLRQTHLHPCRLQLIKNFG